MEHDPATVAIDCSRLERGLPRLKFEARRVECEAQTVACECLTVMLDARRVGIECWRVERGASGLALECLRVELGCLGVGRGAFEVTPGNSDLRRRPHRYNPPAAAPTAAGRGNPTLTQGGQHVVRDAHARLFYGGPGGAAYGLAGFLGCQFSTSAVGPATLTWK